MQDCTEYLEVDFIIWNSAFGVRDFVTIGKIDSKTNSAWLDDPYEMVGPFCLEELLKTGEISFAACIVMTEQRWKEGKIEFQKEAYKNQCKAQKELNKEIHRHNQKRQQIQDTLDQHDERKYRELLSLPLEGMLQISQVKAAYRLIVKKVHPDVGGSDEKFVQVTHARDNLLQLLK